MDFSIRRLAFSGFAVWMVLLMAALYFLMPLRKTLNFGIDLVGGTYLKLEVHTDKAVEVALQDKMEGLLSALRKAKKEMPELYDVKEGQAVLKFKTIGATQDAASLAKRDDRDVVMSVEADTITIRFTDTASKRIKREAVDRTIEVLRVRLDKLGVAEIQIAPYGEKQVVVELPNISDPQQAKAMIGTSAVLDFRIVERDGRSPEDILYEYDGQLPQGMEILPGNARAGRDEKVYYLVQKRAPVTGKDLKDARPRFDNDKAQMVVAFEMTADGGDKFYEMTSRHYGRVLAAVLDGVVITAATINGKISTHGEISGTFTPDEVKELSLLLKSGSLPARISFEEERTIGPTLGSEAIYQGFIACMIGLGLVFLFSLFYYSVSGLLAFITLLYNLVLILLGLSWLQATLTLPGIAGMVLTIGMAIDASILIFERIREELKAGVSVRKAVNDGFSDAMRVIIDANITTFITGLVLYKFGTGPIQGFAITMMLGIISTLVTGLFFLKSLFNVVLDTFNVQKLRI